MDSIYDFVMAGLEATRGEWRTVAEGSGIPLQTINKIGYRIVKDPGVSRVEKLAKYFRENPPPKQTPAKKQTAA